MDTLLYHETGSTDPAFNLALEEALAEAECSAGRLLLWQNAPAVIIGRHQNACAEVNLPALKKWGVQLVRRLTGGGAVYHDLGNLNFTFILPLGRMEEISPAQVLAPMLDYLSSLGLDVGMEGRNDITLKGGGKISGLASRRLPGKFLLHGTLLYDVNLTRLADVLLVDPAKYRSKGVQSVRARVCNLRGHTDISLQALWQGIRAAYAPPAAAGPAPAAPLPLPLVERAKKLQAERYTQDSWNLGMSPPGDICLAGRFAFGSLELYLGVRGSRINQARICGDFLTAHASGPLPEVEALAQALLGLPAHAPETWAAAWQKFDFSRIFLHCKQGEEILDWLARGSRSGSASGPASGSASGSASGAGRPE